MQIHQFRLYVVVMAASLIGSKGFQQFARQCRVSMMPQLRALSTGRSGFESPTTQSALFKQSSGAWLRRLLKGSLLIPTIGFASAAFAEESGAKPSEQPKADADGFITTDSGLRYRDLTVGTGDSPVPGDMVRVHYTGWLDNFDSPKKFDSSYDRRSPLAFKVGTKQVIAGWDEGILTNLKVGGKRELIIPAPLGYGSRGAGGVIPPNATLYFRIELVGIGAKAKL